MLKIFLRFAFAFACAAVLRAEFKADIEYGRAGDVPLLLDANIPEGEGTFPIAILVHGGGWGSGDKKGAEKPGSGADISPWFGPLTAAKFTWFSINYRLAPQHRWPACFDDVQTAIRWVKAHAAEFKGDPKRIAIFGHSAGGHLALLAALQTNDDTRVQAAVGYAPVTDFEQELPTRGGIGLALQNLHGLTKDVTPEALKILRETAPIHHIQSKGNHPPFLILHGEADKTVPLQQTLNFQARLRANSVPCDLLIIPGAPHRLTEWSKTSADHDARMIAWLRNVLDGKPGFPVEVPSASSEPAPAQPLTLWYRQPASAWTEALPIGNGRLGAMVFGGIAEERLQLNEDSLWTGLPHAYQHEGAVKFLPEIRQLLAEGKQKAAEDLAMREFMSVPLRQEAYQPLGDLLLQFKGHDNAANYRRELDLDAALSTVHYSVGDVVYTRTAFSSQPDQVLVQRIATNDTGRLSFALRLACPHGGTYARAIDDNTLLVTGRVAGDGLKFAAVVRVLTQAGSVSVTPAGIMVDKADTATVLVTAATNYKNFRDVSADPEALAIAAMQAAAARSYDELLARHQADHRALFRRVTLDLGATSAVAQPTDIRMQAADKTADAQLAALLFNYGRYLLIASSRPGDQAANLQGIWNDRTNPPWGSKYTTNINLQMNYWPAEVANLSECTEPLWSMLDDLVVSGRETARAHYGARGWVLHHNTDLWRGTAPINASNHGIWPTGGAWLCRHLWEHYLFTGNREFLAKRAYPIMREAALFFVDYLVRDPKTGWLISGPSNSPEQGGLVMGPTMDHQIIRALFASTAAAAETLKIDADFAAQLWKLRDQIAPNQIGKHGQLQEWMQDIDDPKNTHRHTSHLWGVYPGHEIRPQTPELFAAAKKSLLFRGDDGTGWSLGWKILFWARFLDGDHAWRMLQQQLRFVPSSAELVYTKGGGTYSNLFDAHPPFQIDGNFAATAGICEMLVQSHLDEIVLLPALPSAWASGSVTGLRARGGFELSFTWREGKLVSLTLKSLLGNPVNLRAGTAAVRLQPKAGESLVLGPDLKPLSKK
ncbi:MAG: glycoside hydrolase N-terminal domain-containing protein [Nibricoccus sp.]